MFNSVFFLRPAPNFRADCICKFTFDRMQNSERIRKRQTGCQPSDPVCPRFTWYICHMNNIDILFNRSLMKAVLG
jgi:hypothetical protein